MDPTHRTVTTLPLDALWTERGPLSAARERALGRPDVVTLLQRGAVHFVVADVGRPLRWVAPAECFVFWKADVRTHLVDDPSRPIDVYAYPEGYAYVASEWAADEAGFAPLVVLERHH